MNLELPSREAIAERAYCLWEQAGRPAGRDEEFWLRAEAELAPQASTTGVPPIIAPRMATPPPIPTASSMHQVPPPIEVAVQSLDRRRTTRAASPRPVQRRGAVRQVFRRIGNAHDLAPGHRLCHHENDDKLRNGQGPNPA